LEKAMHPKHETNSGPTPTPGGLQRFFKLQQHGTTVNREIIAGLTTFTTMSYIVVVNPAILKNAGIPPEPSMVATVLASVFGCLLMAFYANRPFAIAPYMGENAFIAGVIFVLLTLFRLRTWMVESVPLCLRYSFAVGIGLFLSFIGLNQTGIVVLGVPGAPVHAGALTSRPVLVAIFGFVLISILIIRKVYGAILIGIVVTAFVAYATGVAPAPHSFLSVPPALTPIFMQMDMRGALSWGAFPVVLTIFIMAFVDTMGTLIGLSARAGFLDKNGNLPEIEKPMLVDALATTLAPMLGTTTSGVFVESATGIEAGGRTGLSTLIVAACFALSVFASPFVAAIPPQAYGPALIVVGLFMLAPIRQIDFEDYSESVPSFAIVALTCFTFNIAIGITAGFVLYPLCKLVAGKAREIRPGLWLLTALSLLFFVFYPYR
jgi:AGZA family xanthine/uracil permease-like MFS transporter